ncbi:MAG: hypothetical protein WC455_16650 [Dehalococcoidia bacterium]
MNYTIWKYLLNADEYNRINMPKGAQILSIHVQRGMPCMWVLVDAEQSLVERVFEIFGTGHRVPMEMGMNRNFIGTFMVESETLVFHVFERID